MVLGPGLGFWLQQYCSFITVTSLKADSATLSTDPNLGDVLDGSWFTPSSDKQGPVSAEHIFDFLTAAQKDAVKCVAATVREISSFLQDHVVSNPKDSRLFF